MFKFLRQYSIPAVFIILLALFSINLYLNAETAYQETALTWYNKYISFNNTLSENFRLGITMLFESISKDTRNYIFALLLRPVYLLFGTSHKAFIIGIFLLFYLPSVISICYFINFCTLNNLQTRTKNFLKYFTLFIVLTIPIYWFIGLIGYPDIFSLGLFCCALILFFKYPFNQRIPFKIILTFSILMYLSYLFRRWFLIVIIAFVISALLSEIINCALEKPSLIIIKSKIFSLSKNLFLFGIIFLIGIAIIQPDILINILNTEYRDIFKAYSVSSLENYKIIRAYITLPIGILSLLILTLNIKFSKGRNFVIFSAVNTVVYVLVFHSVQLICIDHLTVFIFWLINFLIAGIYQIINNDKIHNFFKISVILLAVFFNFINFFYVFKTQRPMFSEYFVQQVRYSPYQPENMSVIKEIEKEIKNEIDKNNNREYIYCIWAFENASFNFQLFFQNGKDIKYFERGIWPPLVDRESIITGGCGFYYVIKADVIYTTEPLQPYIEGGQDNKILFKTHEMLKNQTGFAKAYIRDPKTWKLKNGETVVKYVRKKPLTKKDCENYKKELFKIYPWAENYFPEYFNQVYENAIEE